MKSAIRSSGAVIPATYRRAYIAPQNREPGSIESASTPAKTGAQQSVAKAEKTPRMKTEPAPVIFVFWCLVNGIEKWNPSNIDAPSSSKKAPPITKIKSWFLPSKAPMPANPRPRGRNTASNPRKNTSVIPTTVLFWRKMEPRYAGSRTVMQHGANNAAVPAMKAAMRDAKRSVDPI